MGKRRGGRDRHERERGRDARGHVIVLGMIPNKDFTAPRGV